MTVNVILCGLSVMPVASDGRSQARDLLKPDLPSLVLSLRDIFIPYSPGFLSPIFFALSTGFNIVDIDYINIPCSISLGSHYCLYKSR